MHRSRTGPRPRAFLELVDSESEQQPADPREREREADGRGGLASEHFRDEPTRNLACDRDRRDETGQQDAVQVDATSTSSGESVPTPAESAVSSAIPSLWSRRGRSATPPLRAGRTRPLRVRGRSPERRHRYRHRFRIDAIDRSAVSGRRRIAVRSGVRRTQRAPTGRLYHLLGRHRRRPRGDVDHSGGTGVRLERRCAVTDRFDRGR